jgi:hypothetical protein
MGNPGRKRRAWHRGGPAALKRCRGKHWMNPKNKENICQMLLKRQKKHGGNVNENTLEKVKPAARNMRRGMRRNFSGYKPTSAAQCDCDVTPITQ